jgi:hypothetical protein
MDPLALMASDPRETIFCRVLPESSVLSIAQALRRFHQFLPRRSREDTLTVARDRFRQYI